MVGTASPAPPAGVPAERFEFATTDPDEAQDFIGRMWQARPPKAGPRLDRISPVSISQVSAGGMSHVDFTMPPDLTLHLAGTDDVSVTTLVTGVTQAELGRDSERYAVGDSFLGSFQDSDYVVRCVDFRAVILTVPAAAFDQVTGRLPDQPRPALRFDSLRADSPAAARHWQRAAGFARDLLDSDQSAVSALMLGSAARMLAATALSVFPNDVVIEAGQEPRDAHPRVLRRAVAFIDDNAHADISVTDVAAACFVNPRTIQLAFRRHLNTTPSAYLRRVRLERAHQELKRALPGDGTTVTTVAYQWGFGSASRFRAAYRSAYETNPSDTLNWK